jgi:hypothetical protein
MTHSMQPGEFTNVALRLDPQQIALALCCVVQIDGQFNLPFHIAGLTRLPRQGGRVGPQDHLALEGTGCQ